MKKDGVCLLVDIGNSALKMIGWNRQTHSFVGQPMALDWAAAIDVHAKIVKSATLEPLLQLPIEQVLISSVNRQYQSMLLELFAGSLPDAVCQIVRYADVPMQIDLPHPERLGMDRLLAGFAAANLTSSDGPIAVLQIGTAVTLDLILPSSPMHAANPTFCGGVIFPSANTLLQSLADKTDRLPRLKAEYDNPVMPLPGERLEFASVDAGSVHPAAPGKETASAMQIGIRNCVLGGIERVYQDYQRQHPDVSIQVIATGGGAFEIAKELELPIQVVSNLVLKGLSLLQHAD